MRRLLLFITPAILLAYFLFFTLESVRFYFDSDDMMNLYMAWRQPLAAILKANLFFWSDSFRPFGALFYRALFALVGFNPVPFRVVCLSVGILNLALCFRFIRLVTDSDRIAALAALLFCFDSRLMEVWFRTGVVYDLLSFTFFYVAACLYIAARRPDRYPGPGRSLAILLCYVCALNSKEVAVALPVVLLAWELLFARFAWRRLWLIGILSLTNIPFILGKTLGPLAMTNNPAYKPEYSYERFAHSWATFLNFLFIRDEGSLSPAASVAILIAMPAAALVVRSRVPLFAWTIVMVSTLPVIFLPYRGGFVLYVSYVGWTLYVAAVLVRLQDLTPARYRTALACVVFVLVGWRWGKLNLHDQRSDPRHWMYDPARMVHDMADQMRALNRTLPKGARTLFVSDPFPADDWAPYFIMKLIYRDDAMVIDRFQKMDRKPADWQSYGYVFTDDGRGRYRRLKP